MGPDAKPVVDHQRRLNPKMKEVVRTEILNLLEAGIIYPIADIRWVSPVHCLPKKGGITVVPVGSWVPQTIETFELWGAHEELSLPSLPTQQFHGLARRTKGTRDTEIYPGLGHLAV